MFKSFYVFFVFCVCVFSVFVSFSYADDFGCKCLLCLASPAGPMQYEECRPTIRKLYNRLYNRKPFPSCNMKSSDGITVNQGKELYMTCEEAYGEGYVETDITVDSDYGSSSETICRKYLGTSKEYVCNDFSGCDWVEKEVFSDKALKRRSEPYYIEVLLNGEQKGQKFYYKKKSKKKGLF